MRMQQFWFDSLLARPFSRQLFPVWGFVQVPARTLGSRRGVMARVVEMQERMYAVGRAMGQAKCCRVSGSVTLESHRGRDQVRHQRDGGMGGGAEIGVVYGWSHVRPSSVGYGDALVAGWSRKLRRGEARPRCRLNTDGTCSAVKETTSRVKQLRRQVQWWYCECFSCAKYRACTGFAGAKWKGTAWEANSTNYGRANRECLPTIRRPILNCDG